MATGNMHKNSDSSAMWFLSYASGQADKQTHHDTLHPYYVGEVTKNSSALSTETNKTRHLFHLV